MEKEEEEKEICWLEEYCYTEEHAISAKRAFPFSRLRGFKRNAESTIFVRNANRSAEASPRFFFLYFHSSPPLLSLNLSRLSLISNQSR